MGDKKLFKSRLNKFIVKRATVLLILLMTVDLAFLEKNRWLVLAGLLVGAFVSVGRFSSNEWLLKKVFQLNGDKAVTGSIVAFTLNQLILMPIIAITYFLNVWALYGLVVGFLVVPAIIMINSITEAFGITKNSFE